MNENEKQIIANTIITLFKKDSPLVYYLDPEEGCSFGRLVELLREKFDLTNKELSYSHIYPTAFFNAKLGWDFEGEGEEI